MILYHGTTHIFSEFKETEDIGFHFGTKKAALTRIKAKGGLPSVKIEKQNQEALSQEAKSALLFKEIILSESHSFLKKYSPLQKKAFETIYPRLDNPKFDLKEYANIIMSMNEDELKKEISNYEKKSFSTKYLDRTRSQIKDSGFNVIVNGESQYFTTSKKEAHEKAREYKSSFIKKVKTSELNPIRLPDLGTWHPDMIIKELTLSNDKKKNFYQLSKSDKYKWLINEISEQGYDSIIYKNEVEGKSDSYILFNTNQFTLINDPTPSPSLSL